MKFQLPISMRDLTLMLIVVLTWGFHVPVIRFGVLMVEPFSLNFVRFVGTAFLFLPFAERISFDDLKKIFPVSMLFVAGNLMFSYIAMSYITSNSFIMIVQLVQPFTLIMAWFFFKERFGLITCTGIILSLSGLAVVFGTPDIATSPMGAFFAIIAALCWSGGSIAMKRTGHLKPATFLAYAYLFSIPIAFLGTAIFEDNQIQHFIDANPYEIGFVIIYQVVLMGIMTFVWSGLIARNPAQYVTPFLMLQPIVAIIGSYFLLQETLTQEVLIGGLIVLAGVGIINMQKIKKATPATEQSVSK